MSRSRLLVEWILVSFAVLALGFIGASLRADGGLQLDDTGQFFGRALEHAAAGERGRRHFDAEVSAAAGDCGP